MNSFLHSLREKETVRSQGTNILLCSVRTHEQLMGYSWAKLWYYLRGIDAIGWRRSDGSPQENYTYCQSAFRWEASHRKRDCQNSGLLKAVSFQEAKHNLGCASSTLYQWLREAVEAGAIYEYKRQGDRITVRLGGLFNVCRTLGLKNWGAVAMQPLKQVLSKCRALATAIATQQLQGQSRYAAQKSLSNSDQKVFTIPKALDVISKGKTASHEPIRGATKIPFLIHVGAKRAFVSKGFIPFGTSQGAVASELGISDRTVRRHLSELEVESRQICQSKQEYAMVNPAIRYGAGEYVSESDVRFRIDEGEIVLHERNGWTSHSRSGGHHIPLNGSQLNPSCDRFFTYFGKTWLYRCSIYGLSHHLKKMKVARRNYKNYLAKHKVNLSPKPSVAGISEHKNL